MIEVLGYIGKLGLLGSVIWYLVEIPKREQAAADAKKAKQYAAWQLLNAATHKKGNAGRILALQDLNRDGVLMPGLDLVEAQFFEPLVLTNAYLRSADFSSAEVVSARFEKADLRRAKFDDARFTGTSFDGAIMYEATFLSGRFNGCSFNGALFDGASMAVANFQRCDFSHAGLSEIDLQQTTFTECNFANAILPNVIEYTEELRDRFYRCNLYGITNLSSDFIVWAKSKAGCVSVPATNLMEWRRWLTANPDPVR